MGEIARRLGKPLMPHQQLMADVLLEIDPETGLLAYDECVIIGPRQVTGKTEFLLPVMTHRCTGFGRELTDWVRRELGIVHSVPGPQTVLYTTQNADKAREKWRDVHLARLLASPFYRPRPQFSYRLQRNTEAIMWRNGSMWSPGSTTGKTAGTGDTLDLPVIDEAWSRPDNRTELGMRPAKMTRAWSQLLVLSMIPGLSRCKPGEWPYLKSKRDLGRARVAAGVRRGMAFFDFAAPDGLDPGDPDTWATCMPGLGRTVRESTVRADFEAMVGAGQLVDFCAEYLGWEPLETVAGWRLVSKAVWEGREDPGSAIAGRPALAVEMDEERRLAWIVAAGYREDGDFHVEVVEPGFRVLPHVTGVDWVQRRVLEIWEGQRPWTVVVDPGGPAAALVVPLKNAGVDVLTPSGSEIAGGCGRFVDATGQAQPEGGRTWKSDEDETAADRRRLWHLGQRVLDRAVRLAAPVASGRGSMVVVHKGTDPVVRPLQGAVLALLGLLVKGSTDYDLLDSVDDSRPCSCGRYAYRLGDGWRHADDDSPACE